MFRINVLFLSTDGLKYEDEECYFTHLILLHESAGIVWLTVAIWKLWMGKKTVSSKTQFVTILSSA